MKQEQQKQVISFSAHEPSEVLLSYTFDGLHRKMDSQNEQRFSDWSERRLGWSKSKWRSK